jgi:hypothetical protein
MHSQKKPLKGLLCIALSGYGFASQCSAKAVPALQDRSKR